MSRTLTPNALEILERRYLLKDGQGRVRETPEEMFWRVAKAVGRAERRYGLRGREVKAVEARFHALLADLLFLPNSPTLMNAGKRRLHQLAACFVLPVGDSMAEIFEAVKHTALIHQSGGGTGFSFSRLRPRNDLVSTTGGVASGPISFMRVFNVATDVIKQGGTRRGANMGILRVDHPEIFEFIHAKEDPEAFASFNLSVGATDAFMRAVKADRTYALVNPRTGKDVKRLRARQVFNAMGQAAWRNGEPGLVFLDRINRDNPTPHLGPIESTNPCGEQPLLPYEACVLGSINVALMVKETPRGSRVDWKGLGEAVTWAVRFLDNTIDVNQYPLPEIERMARGNRKIGLGVMGWADLLIRLGIPYDDPKALRLAGRLMGFIQKHAREASVAMARKRGLFPNFKGSVYDRARGLRPRNATQTTIAPTGTVSMIAGCSSGIEPLFALAYRRRVINTVLTEVHPLFAQAAREQGFYHDRLFPKVAEAGGSIQAMPRIPEPVRRVFLTTYDIAPEVHVRMQAAFQRHTDNAVSKTVNLPASASPKDVARIFWLAYRLGCKGITLYRYGTRPQPITFEDFVDLTAPHVTCGGEKICV